MVVRRCCFDGARRSVHDELRPHVPVGFTPWERYGTVAAASISALLDREEAERSRRLGRALDLGCGRGQYTPEFARRGWEAVGIDYVPAAIEAAAAKSRGVEGLGYVVGDVTRLESARLGTPDFFLDIGCFQGLDAEQRLSLGEVSVRLPTLGPQCCCCASARAGGGGWSGAHRERRSRPPSRAGRCSRPSRRTPRAWAGR